ncbi:MAG: hypothetical protein IJL32_00670 [Oscillospiraceae bacterium]|nr:hypothetical protein [Oscillospiraceae bacterium]
MINVIQFHFDFLPEKLSYSQIAEKIFSLQIQYEIGRMMLSFFTVSSIPCFAGKCKCADRFVSPLAKETALVSLAVCFQLYVPVLLIAAYPQKNTTHPPENAACRNAVDFLCRMIV